MHKRKKSILTTIAVASMILSQPIEASNWVQDENGWWWQEDNNSYPINKWQEINGHWYWFDNSGYMTTGWEFINEVWYWFNASGAMTTGWEFINGVWYWFDASGAMATGWEFINGVWYWFDASGAMATGWEFINGVWYWFDASGAMTTDKWIDNYYVQADGTMATSKWIGDYYVDASGLWVDTRTEDTNPSPFKDSSFSACSINTTQLGKFQYWLYTPSNPTENMPLIVYLHGGSGKGNDLNLLTSVDGFPQYLQNGLLGDVRAYVIIPQLPTTQKGWADISESIYDLIDSMITNYQINKNNISLTGHSMGGTGTWNLACIYPMLFARIAPLSGSIRNTADTIDKLKNIPVKAFVGSADSIVSPNYSKEVVAALKAAGGNAEVIVFDGADHFSVPSLTFLDNNIDLVDWLIGNK